ncbi:MAG: hypothetical protein PF495_11730 [Spirochaetales bacterium]|jgi:hypothetical protein|nr:hypothetical protein [Spirochaetales bacterium]
MKLEITKDKVVRTARKCSYAKKILEAMFPEAFEDEGFGSGTGNMTTLIGAYHVSGEGQGNICRIIDGYLTLIPDIKVKGIKTDEEGRILVKVNGEVLNG